MSKRHNEFDDEEYRYGYSESLMDTLIAAQIKALREQRGLSQSELAGKLATSQSVISRLENVNYSAWNISTLKRLARVLGVRLKVSFEEFADIATEVNNLSLKNLTRRSYQDAPVRSHINRKPTRREP